MVWDAEERGPEGNWRKRGIKERRGNILLVGLAPGNPKTRI